MFENAPTWSSNANEAKTSENESWGNNAPSSNQNSYETFQSKDAKNAGRKR